MEKINVKDVSLSSSMDDSRFCDAWPAAKAGLSILKEVVKNPIVKISIGAIITLGDSLCTQ